MPNTPASQKTSTATTKPSADKNVAPKSQVPSAGKAVVDDSTKLDNNNQPNQVVHPLSFDEKGKKSMPRSKKASPLKFVIAGVVAILLGVATGYGSYELYAQSMGVPTGGNIEKVATGDVQKGDVFGSADTSTFKDSAKGYIEAGGLDGEGTHSLLRAGGPSQTVYLTSSVTDLDKLVGMEVELWGETFKGQKAGWLMDVGRVEVIKVDGEKPVE